ncbi:MAG: chorismate pyruvate-lyase family protein [Rhodococcus sp. (in: high G+C Gram-positive bacteria)]
MTNDKAVPDPELRSWLEIDHEVCVRRHVELSGASTGTTYVRAVSYLHQPRLPDAFLGELDRPGASLGTQMIESRISSRRELIWVRPSADRFYSRLYRILVQDRPAILIQEDFVGIRTPLNLDLSPR